MSCRLDRSSGVSTFTKTHTRTHQSRSEPGRPHMSRSGLKSLSTITTKATTDVLRVTSGWIIFPVTKKKLRWRVERVKIISCSSGMLPLSRKWIHAAARLHKHQRDSKTGWWMMLTILLIIKERGLCGSITERHTTLFRQFVSFVIFLKLCQQLLSYIFLAPEPETWNLWLTKAQVSP